MDWGASLGGGWSEHRNWESTYEGRGRWMEGTVGGEGRDASVGCGWPGERRLAGGLARAGGERALGRRERPRGPALGNPLVGGRAGAGQRPSVERRRRAAHA